MAPESMTVYGGLRKCFPLLTEDVCFLRCFFEGNGKTLFPIMPRALSSRGKWSVQKQFLKRQKKLT